MAVIMDQSLENSVRCIILLHFYLFKNVKNKIKINLCLLLNQFFIVHTIPCATFEDLT